MTYNIYGLILAGGTGSRLWPLSRELFPKQLLSINNVSNESLFQKTIKRLDSIIKPENLYIITNNKLESDLNQQYNQINTTKNKPNFIIEPANRNTAPAILLSTLHLLKTFKTEANEAVIISAPSDHLINDTKGFYETINRAINLAKKDFIITLGIKPTKADTNYGYINTIATDDYHKVNKFIEKPDFKTANKFLKSEHYYWNSGILIFKASTILQEFKKHAPDLYEQANNINYSKTSFDYEEFKYLPDISIDNAILEKSNKIALIPCNFDWNDLGNWDSVLDNSIKDSNNNAISGNVITTNCENTLIYGSDNLIAAAGLKNKIIVSTEDATLICDTNNAKEVKDIYNKLQKRNDQTYKTHRTLLRPWGYKTLLKEEHNYIIKTICIKPNQQSSLQMHNHKTKNWTIIEGQAIIILNKKQYILNPGETINILPKEKHSIQNNETKDLLLIEIQTGTILKEDDIVRFE